MAEGKNINAMNYGSLMEKISDNGRWKWVDGMFRQIER